MNNVAYQRPINQQIAFSSFHSASELVHYLGAMQAQEFAMAKWAIAFRLPHLKEKDIALAFDKTL